MSQVTSTAKSTMEELFRETIDGYEIVVVEHLNEQQVAQWVALASTSPFGSLFSSSKWCEVMAQADGVPQMLFLAYRNGVLEGGVTTDPMPGNVAPHYNVQGILEGNRIVEGIPAWQCPVELMPCMLATTRAGRTTDFRLRPGAPTKAVVKALVRAMEIFGVTQGANSSALIYIPTTATEIGDALSELNYRKALIGVHCYLPVTFSDINGYFNLFNSKRRRRIRAEYLRAVKHPAIRFIRSGLGDRVEDMVQYCGYNFTKYGMAFNREAYIQRTQFLADTFGDDAIVLEMYHQNRLVGMLQCLRNREMLAVRVCGIHPDTPKALNAYFQLVFYQPILLALELGVTLIEYGPELPDTKISHGCDIAHQQLFLKTDDPRIIRRLDEIDRFMGDRIAELDRQRQQFKPAKSMGD